MIKKLNFKDAPFARRPSNSQLKRLTVGDDAELCMNDKCFWVKIAFVRSKDLVGIVVRNEGIEDLEQDDLVSFETHHISRVIPDPARMKLPPFMLLTHHDNKEQTFVLHTKAPRMIAVINFGDKVKAEEAVWIDEPEDYDNVAPELLQKMTDWYFYNYLNKEQ